LRTRKVQCDPFEWDNPSNTTLGPKVVFKGTQILAFHREGFICEMSNGSVTDGITLCLGMYYAFSLSYPRGYANILAFFQGTCVSEVMDFQPKKVLSDWINKWKQGNFCNKCLAFLSKT
jgi:hypothetical protein